MWQFKLRCLRCLPPRVWHLKILFRKVVTIIIVVLVFLVSEKSVLVKCYSWTQNNCVLLWFAKKTEVENIRKSSEINFSKLERKEWYWQVNAFHIRQQKAKQNKKLLLFSNYAKNLPYTSSIMLTLLASWLFYTMLLFLKVFFLFK